MSQVKELFLHTPEEIAAIRQQAQDEARRQYEREKAAEPQKFDGEKNRVELLPPDALEEIAKALSFGAKKYAAGNWATGSGFRWSRLYGALLRHLYAWARGEETDPESGLSHLAHAGCMLLFLLSHILRRHGTDDREEIGVRDKGNRP